MLFSLDNDSRGRSAAAVASLVAQDVMAICGELRRIGVEGDGLVWFEQCGDVPAGVLTELITRGARAGLPAVLTTTSAQAAEKLADQVNAVVIHRMTDPVMAERFARITGEKLVPGEAGPQAPGAARVGGAAVLRTRVTRHAIGLCGTWPLSRPALRRLAARHRTTLHRASACLATRRRVCRPRHRRRPAAPRSCAGPWCHPRPCVAWATASSSCWSRPRSGGSSRWARPCAPGCTHRRADVR